LIIIIIISLCNTLRDGRAGGERGRKVIHERKRKRRRKGKRKIRLDTKTTGSKAEESVLTE